MTTRPHETTVTPIWELFDQAEALLSEVPEPMRGALATLLDALEEADLRHGAAVDRVAEADDLIGLVRTLAAALGRTSMVAGPERDACLAAARALDLELDEIARREAVGRNFARAKKDPA